MIFHKIKTVNKQFRAYFILWSDKQVEHTKDISFSIEIMSDLLQRIIDAEDIYNKFVVPEHDIEAAYQRISEHWQEIRAQILVQSENWQREHVVLLDQVATAAHLLEKRLTEALSQIEDDLLQNENDDSDETSDDDSLNKETQVATQNLQILLDSNLSPAAKEFVPTNVHPSTMSKNVATEENASIIEQSITTSVEKTELSNTAITTVKNSGDSSKVEPAMPQNINNDKKDSVQPATTHTTCITTSSQSVQKHKEPCKHDNHTMNVSRDILKELITLPLLPKQITIQMLENFRQSIAAIVKKIKEANMDFEALEPLIIVRIIDSFSENMLLMWNLHHMNKPFTFSQLREFLATVQEHMLSMNESAARYNSNNTAYPSTSTGCANSVSRYTGTIPKVRPHTMIRRRENSEQFEAAVLGPFAQQQKKQKVDPALIKNCISRCFECGRKHPLYTCKIFLRRDRLNRIRYVESKLLCPNCLRGLHDVTECCMDLCSRCKEPHNSVLCPKSPTANPPGSGASA